MNETVASLRLQVAEGKVLTVVDEIRPEMLKALDMVAHGKHASSMFHGGMGQHNTDSLGKFIPGCKK